MKGIISSLVGFSMLASSIGVFANGHTATAKAQAATPAATVKVSDAGNLSFKALVMGRTITHMGKQDGVVNVTMKDGVVSMAGPKGHILKGQYKAKKVNDNLIFVKGKLSDKAFFTTMFVKMSADEQKLLNGTNQYWWYYHKVFVKGNHGVAKVESNGIAVFDGK